MRYDDYDFDVADIIFQVLEKDCFVDSKMVDKVYAFQTPLIIGGKDAVSAVGGTGVSMVKEALQLKNITYQHFDETLLTTGDVD